MSGWAPKRFWTQARVVETPEGAFTVLLDERPVRTPAKALLHLPTRALAEAIAAEWQVQESLVDPRTMPMTGSANAAIDKVAAQHAEVAELIAAYGGSDHLCYRAAEPEALRLRQEAAWDPILAWAAEALGAPLNTGTGVIPIAQPTGSVANLTALVTAMDTFALTALSDLVGLSGSLVLGLAVSQGTVLFHDAWHVSRIDEDYQAEIWGTDPEAEMAAERKARDFAHAAQFGTLARQNH